METQRLYRMETRRLCRVSTDGNDLVKLNLCHYTQWLFEVIAIS